MKKVKVGILGATGNVGQRFVELLSTHPWFEITSLLASEKSAGKKYKDVCQWRVSDAMPKKAENMVVGLCEPNVDATLVFSGLDSGPAGPIEEAFAKKGYKVISNASSHRMDSDVPMLIPEVNPEHLGLLDIQKKRLGSQGYIITKPNCTTIGLVMVLKPLHDAFGIKKVMVTTMQAVSGAGYPGVASLDILDNVVPYIGGEEEKVIEEPLKLLGKLAGGKINFATIVIDAHCNRVSVRDGHMENVTIEFAKKPNIEAVKKVLETFTGEPQKRKLPLAPLHPIIVRDEANRPQPILDRDTENGMSVTVGRIRKSTIFDINLSLLVHNTLRGAAGGGVLTAELLYDMKLL